MNFYEHQERARKQTGRLLVLFLLALIALVLLTAFVLAAVAYMLGFYSSPSNYYGAGHALWDVVLSVFEWQYLGSITLAVLVVVSLAALFRMSQLSSGGKAIAEQLGGYLLNTRPRNSAEKRLLNVVEEMAIAAGTPVPSVYLIEEPGINAFAAGHQPADAVIGVTRGALEQLNRQELQGVIAHEFSHILNGDMRLNLRLIGLIYGIIVIALAGRYLLRGSYYSGYGRSRGGSGRDRGAVLGMGLALVALGYLGVFFGNIIKAAISRQREYLADASAVQFTRSHEGISGALKKIGGQSAHADWQQHDANEISHMLFSKGLKFNFFNRFMSTHPPLEKRIQRVDPQWDGSFLSSASVSSEYKSNLSQQKMAGGTSASFTGADNTHARGGGVDKEILITGLSADLQLTEAKVAESARQLSSLKAAYHTLYEQIHQPYMARALVYALLVDRHGCHDSSTQEVRLGTEGASSDDLIKAKAKKLQRAQWLDIQKNQSAPLFKQTQSVFKQLQILKPHQSMMLLDLALPVLKLLTDNQYVLFKQQMLRLIKMDKKIELREWALFNLVNYFCRPSNTASLHFLNLSQRKPALAKLLAALVRLNIQAEDEAKALFDKVSNSELSLSLRWYPESELTIQSLTQALQQIRQVKPLEKPRFLKACIQVIEHDGIVEANELEVVSCIAQAMDCPLPTSFLLAADEA
ncbi:MAG: M48 family metallopeptidase [Cellvibrionaceae bacterium]